jgi:Zn-dependent protease with chaperone function
MFLEYYRKIWSYYFGKDKIQLIGLDEDKYPYFSELLKKFMGIYRIEKIRIIVKNQGFNAGTFSFFGDRIIISRKLLEEFNQNEIEAVLAHEFAHAYYRDYFLKIVLSLAISLPFLFFLLTYNFVPQNPFYPVLILITFFLLIYGLKIINWISVEFEILSDREAALNIDNPEYLEKTLFKLYIHHATMMRRPSNFEKLNQGWTLIKRYFLGTTHPVLKERIEHIKFTNEMKGKLKKN